MHIEAAQRTARSMSVGAVIATCVLGGCITELPVDTPTGTDIVVGLDGLDSLNMVGSTDTVRLTVELGGVQVTGLRVHWRALDSTALAVRSLTNSGVLDSGATATDSLNATLLGEVSYLRRGTHTLSIQFDSVGLADVQTASVTVTALERWQSIGAGSGHTCAVTLVNAFDSLQVPLREGGEIFCWGEGQFGALGTGSSEQTSIPLRVDADVVFEEVRSGNRYNCASSQTGLLYCWGDNFDGQLGLGHRLDQFVPRLNALGEAFASFDVGKDGLFTCAVRGQRIEGGGPGVTLCWGTNEQGGLGCGTLIGCDPVRLTEPNTADEVAVIDSLFAKLEFESLSVGGSHACGVTEEGLAYCWGTNFAGELGAPTPSSISPIAVEAESGGLRFAQVVTGGRLVRGRRGGYTCGLLQDRSAVHCWGWVVGSANDRTAVPVQVEGLPAETFATLSAGMFHTCALTSEGVAYCWGQNDFGQLGDGTETSRTSAAPVAGGLRFGALSAGEAHTCAITIEAFELPGRPADQRDSGAIYCWGDNTSGQLGDGTEESSSVPVRVIEPDA